MEISEWMLKNYLNGKFVLSEVALFGNMNKGEIDRTKQYLRKDKKNLVISFNPEDFIAIENTLLDFPKTREKTKNFLWEHYIGCLIIEQLLNYCDKINFSQDLATEALQKIKNKSYDEFYRSIFSDERFLFSTKRIQTILKQYPEVSLHFFVEEVKNLDLQKHINDYLVNNDLPKRLYTFERGVVNYNYHYEEGSEPLNMSFYQVEKFSKEKTLIKH